LPLHLDSTWFAEVGGATFNLAIAQIPARRILENQFARLWRISYLAPPGVLGTKP
jgi:hypothetical protein